MPEPNYDIESYSDDLKTLPTDIDAEKAFLCCVMIHDSSSGDFRERLSVPIHDDYFYKNEHRHIWESIIRLIEKGARIDPITLYDQLSIDKKANEAGGPVYIAELLGATSTSANMSHYAEIVSKKYILRQLINSHTNAIEGLFQENDSTQVQSVYNEAVETTFLKSSSMANAYAVPDLCKEINAKIEEDMTKEGVSGLRFNRLRDLQDAFDGLQSGVHIFAANENVGKSILFCNMAVDLLESNEDVYVLYYSLDDPKKKWMNYMMCAISGGSLSFRDVKLPGELISDGEGGRFKFDNYTDVCSQFKEYATNNRLICFDQSDVENDSIFKYHIRRTVKEYSDKKVVVFVDGGYNLNPDEKHEFQTDLQIEKRRANVVKNIADMYDIPVVFSGEIRKTADGKKYQEPTTNSLLGSGKLKFHGNTISFMCLDDTVQEYPQKIIVKLLIRKNKSNDWKGAKYLMIHRSKGFLEFDDEGYIIYNNMNGQGGGGHE